MPILIKNFNWSQTSDHIILRLPIKCANHQNIDIFSDDNYLKINALPYFFEVFLLHPIIKSASKCKVLENEVKILLKKADSTPEIWEFLEKPIDQANRVKLKEEIIEHVQVETQNDIKLANEMKCELKRKEIQKEVERESNIRSQIEEFQKNEIKKYNESKNVKKLEEQEMSLNKIVTTKNQTKNVLVKKPISTGKPVAIRKAGTILVEFNERKFPTPQRESQAHIEHEWLMKQKEAKKIIGFCEEDLRPEERDPEWLKQKGDEFYGKNNLLGAISAYSTAIRMTTKCYKLFLNRSAAHFAIGNYKRCIEDCSQAYDLLVPHLPLNIKSRAQCLARRGAALCKLGMLQHGYDEMNAALKLQPSDVQLKEDLKMIEQKLNEQ